MFIAAFCTTAIYVGVWWWVFLVFFFFNCFLAQITKASLFRFIGIVL